MQHGYKKLKTARPMADKKHHTYEVEYPHEDTGHVEKLKDKGRLFRGIKLTFNSLMVTQQSFGNPCNIGTRNCRHPDQWPINSIIHIRLKILMNTPIEFNN